MVCSGIGTTGSIRRVEVCLPFLVQTSSNSEFVGCNGLWSLRKQQMDRKRTGNGSEPEKDRKHHAFVVMSFLDSTSVLTVDAEEGTLSERMDSNPGFDLSRSTITTGLLVDFIAAQVLSVGVRLVDLNNNYIEDWLPGANVKITTAVVKNGLATAHLRPPSTSCSSQRSFSSLCFLHTYDFDYSLIAIGVIEHGKGPKMMVLRLENNKLVVVGTTEQLGQEASCLELLAPENGQCLVLMGTYAPELLLLSMRDDDSSTFEPVDRISLQNLFHGAKLPNGEMASASHYLRHTHIDAVSEQG